MSDDRREEWRRRVRNYILFGHYEAPPEPPIPDVRWLEALALAAFERTADRLDRPGPHQTLAAMSSRGDRWQAAVASCLVTGHNPHAQHPAAELLDPRLREWCWTSDLTVVPQEWLNER